MPSSVVPPFTFQFLRSLCHRTALFFPLFPLQDKIVACSQLEIIFDFGNNHRVQQNLYNFTSSLLMKWYTAYRYVVVDWKVWKLRSLITCIIRIMFKICDELNTLLWDYINTESRNVCNQATSRRRRFEELKRQFSEIVLNTTSEKLRNISKKKKI